MERQSESEEDPMDIQTATGILDAPDSEEEYEDADADRPAASTPAVAAAAKLAACPSETTTGTTVNSPHAIKEKTVAPPAGDNAQSFGKLRKFSEINSRMEKTRIGSYARGGRGDEVFSDHILSTNTFATDPVGPSGSTAVFSQASDSEIGTFPPVYSILRAAKQKKLNAARLAAPFGFLRVSEKRIGYGVGGMSVPGDARGFMAQNFHCGSKGLNISFSLMRPDSAPVDEMTCLACPAGHSLAVQMRENSCPVAIVASDQNFPPIAPTDDGKCLVIVRVEDGSLSEIESALTDRFKAYVKPHGSLPAGSVVVIGSLSHLRARGVADYAEAFVGVSASLRNKLGASIEILPAVPIPLHGIDSPALLRALLDFDSWLAAGRHPSGVTLQSTRAVFWQAIRAQGCAYTEDRSVQTYMMPTDARNSRKVPVTSEGFLHQIPSAVPPMSEQAEESIIRALITELNEDFGLSLNHSPNLSRTVDPVTAHDIGKTVFVGASHMRRVCNSLLESGENVVCLCTPGWTPTSGNIQKTAEKIARLGLGGGRLHCSGSFLKQYLPRYR